MISRFWHGWTTPENAQVYQDLLLGTIFPGIMGQNIPGFQGIALHRRIEGDLVEFITLMRFHSLEDVRAFAGEDYERAVVPPAAQAVLHHFDGRSTHYEVIDERGAD